MSERYLTRSVLESITDTCDVFSNIVCCCSWFVSLNVCLFVCFSVLQNNDLRRGYSLCSRRLDVVGERENGRTRGRHAGGEEAPSPLACLLLARPFFLCPLLSSACYAG